MLAGCPSCSHSSVLAPLQGSVFWSLESSGCIILTHSLVEDERKTPFPMSVAHLSSAEKSIVAQRMCKVNGLGGGTCTHVELGVDWEWVGSLEENGGTMTKAGEMGGKMGCWETKPNMSTSWSRWLWKRQKFFSETNLLLDNFQTLRLYYIALREI